MVELDVEAGGIQRFAHATPRLVARDPEILTAERDVVPDAREDDLRIRILQHEPDAATRLARRSSIDEKCSRALAVLIAAMLIPQHSGERSDESRLTGARSAEQQHPLPRLDAEVQRAR